MELTEMDLGGWIQTTDKHAIQAELTWEVLLRREGSGEREIQREAERQTGRREEEKEEEGVGQVPPFKGMGAQRPHSRPVYCLSARSPRGGTGCAWMLTFLPFYLLKKMESGRKDREMRVPSS